ncbi:TPA: hypothetical protein L9B34_000392 [Klebsiella quasipneumoniae]|nr:hypothetical protein [Klebsiella quasipneumoniae]
MSSYSPNPTAAAQPAVTARRSRRRIGILALLAIGTMIIPRSHRAGDRRPKADR